MTSLPPNELAGDAITSSDDQIAQILNCDNHLLVIGGPGAGKTTVALQKALKYVKDGHLSGGQKILFLSFARASVARILEAARRELPASALQSVEINTYHGFAWQLIRSHSYLTNGLSPRFLAPGDIAALLAEYSEDEQGVEQKRLWQEEGLIAFEMFASEATRILTECIKLGAIYSSRYPMIIIDEFQDTNSQQFEMVRALSVSSQLVALADPNQRIYDFAGADPKRIGDYVGIFDPVIVDLSNRNHRSVGTDITQFGNDLLKGANIGRLYSQVQVKCYPLGRGKGSPEFALKTEILGAIHRLGKEGSQWSLAILVPTKALMISLTKYLTSTDDGLPSIRHSVHVDQEGPCLAAAVVAVLLEGGTPEKVYFRLLQQLRNHVRGRKGRKSPPSQIDLGFAISISDEEHLAKKKLKNERETIQACKNIANRRAELSLTGVPEDDWKQMLELLRSEPEPRVTKVAEDARYIRLLRKGSALRDRLNAIWRQHGDYREAAEAVEVALTQVHFAQNDERITGIHLLTIHKSKGKEYDEVILFEDAYQGRYVFKETSEGFAQARLVMRVGITRARRRTTIFTPDGKKACKLILPR